jgi:hypothetical protein
MTASDSESRYQAGCDEKGREEMTVRLWFAGWWLVLAAIFLAILVPINVPDFLRIAMHGQRTTAKIVRLDCENHNSATYAFNVGSEQFERSDVMPTECRSMRIGDVIPVYYDVDDPHISRAKDPKDGLLNEVIPICLVCLTFPPLIIVLAKKKFRFLTRGRSDLSEHQ